MKTKILMMMFLIGTLSIQAQVFKPKSPNVTIDMNGNYREKTDKLTGRYYIDKNGKSFPVYISKNGKLYVITGIGKNGKPKRKYLVL